MREAIEWKLAVAEPVNIIAGRRVCDTFIFDSVIHVQDVLDGEWSAST